MKFNVIATLFEEMSKTTKRIEKIHLLRDFIITQGPTPEELGFLLDSIVGNFQRKLGKKNINVALKSLFESLAATLLVSRSQVEELFRQKGDIGLVAHTLKEDANATGLISTTPLTIKDVQKVLEKLATITGKDANKTKREVVAHSLSRCTTKEELCYLCRFFVGDLKIGMAEGVIREALANALLAKIDSVNKVCIKCGYDSISAKVCCKCGHDGFEVFTKEFQQDEDLFEQTLHAEREVYNRKLELIEKRYHLLNDFTLLVKQFSNEKSSLLDRSLVYGLPCRSMLAETANSAAEALQKITPPCIADFKYDGLRLQIHKQGKNVWLFSRNLDDITQQFPEVVEQMRLFSEDVVFDAECVGYDRDKKCYIPFQEFSKRFLAKEAPTKSNCIVRIFDLLALNKDTLLDLPFEKRRELLEEFFNKRELILI